MICGLCGRDIKPGVLTCPGCRATYGRMVAGWGIGMFVPLFLLLFVGLMATVEGAGREPESQGPEHWHSLPRCGGLHSLDGF